MGDNNYYEARAQDINLESITSTEHNAQILEKLRNNDDAMKWMGITHHDYQDWYEENLFVVHEGDDVGWLGYFIGKSTRLESLFVHHLPGDRSFREGLAQNQSIQELYIWRDLGVTGCETLVHFFQNTNTLEELYLSLSINSFECAQNIALLLSQCQIRSLKKVELEENGLSDEGFEEIARALRAQPQLVELNLSVLSSEDEDAPFGRRGYAALGATMKNWRTPSLRALVFNQSDLDDDGLLALVEGMANCVNLEHLDIGGNDSITEVGLKALSSLFQSKKFSLQFLGLSDVDISNEGMTALASGLAAVESLKSLYLAHNNIVDEGLKALTVVLSNNNNLESLNLWRNGPFSEIGLRQLSDVIPTASNLKELDLSWNSINNEGLQALAVGLRKHRALERLNISSNTFGSEGLRALAAAELTSLRSLRLSNNAINDEALGVLVEGIENFVGLETLNLSSNDNLITSSGLTVLPPIFCRESCSLKEINLDQTKIEDSGAKAFAEALVGNESLTKLLFGYTHLTAVGWSVFSTLLCDTSSVNNTYHSNHTLNEIGSRHYNPRDDRFPSSFQRYLELNRQTQYDVAICKILMTYSDLDMTPLLQWKLKLLPFVLVWFERAELCRTCIYVRESITTFKRRELSAMYQFIHGLPLLVANGFYKHIMSSAAHSKRRK